MELNGTMVNLKEDAHRFVKSIEEVLNPKLSALSLQTPIINLSTPDMLPRGLQSRMVKEADFEPVLSFLRERFFRDEPLNKAVNLLENEGDTCEELESYCMQSLEEGLSVMITDEDDKIVGVGINGTYSRDDILKDYSNECENQKFKKILKLLYTVNKESDIFGQLHDVDIVLDMKIISVDESYRGQGLGHYLLQQANKIAKSENITVIRCECSSAFSAKVMMKLGSKKIYAKKYADYKVDGKIVFHPEPPHEEISIYYYRF